MAAQKTLYQILGVGREATGDEIVRAYRRLALQVHPDAPGGSEAAFKAVEWAKTCLSDPVARASYDYALELEDLADACDRADELPPEPPGQAPRQHDPYAHTRTRRGRTPFWIRAIVIGSALASARRRRRWLGRLLLVGSAVAGFVIFLAALHLVVPIAVLLFVTFGGQLMYARRARRDAANQ